MNAKADQKMPPWALPAFSWLVSFYFLLGFVANVGFPPDRKLLVGDALYVLLWLFFLFLPFFSKIKIGSFLELERELERAKEDLREFKAEVRNSMAVLSTNVNTIGGLTNQVTVNIPGSAELREARQVLDKRASRETKQEAAQVEELLLRPSEDSTLALARTRIEIERLLRTTLGKHSVFTPGRDDAVKFMNIRQLFDLFVRQNDQYAYLKKPFLDVIQVCNAAIHAQRVSEEQAEEALALGAQVIAVLKEVAGEAE
jgi:anion-transporting  ArsA/GET3 family ATPase